MNVITVMLDSLRPDHLGLYGNDWIKTPNLDRFARECTIFERAYAEGMPTIPVRTALFTGKYTLMRRGWQPLDPNDVTLAEILWGNYYDTALISDTAPIHWPRMGHERGFDYVRFIRGQLSDPYTPSPNVKIDLSRWSPKNYLTEKDKRDFIYYLRNRYYWKSEEDHFIARVVKAGIKWLEEKVLQEKKRDKLFLWLDCFDPHEPWDPPEEYYRLYAPKDYNELPIINPSIYNKRGGFIENFTEEEIRHVRAQYAGEVTLVDKWVGILFEKIKELDLWENTLIILLSDHGEPLGEHGIIRKVRPWPYEELSRIVLLIRHPEGLGKNKREKTFVQTTDIFPTIIDFLKPSNYYEGYEKKRFPSSEGISLKPIIEGEAEGIREYAIAGHYKRSWSIRNEKYSLYLWSLEKAEYTFGYSIIREQEKRRAELYGIDRNYVPPSPNNWQVGEEQEKVNLIEEFKDIANSLELLLRRKLFEIL